MAVLPETSVEFLKGVGPQRADTLKRELGIFTCGDLLHFFPYRYIDRSKFFKISELNSEMPYVQLRGKVISMQEIQGKGPSRLTAVFSDDSGSVELIWFQGAKFIKSSIKPGQEYVLFGKPNLFRDKYSIPHPELELLSTYQSGIKGNLQGMYSSTEKASAKGFNSKGIEKLMRILVPELLSSITEIFPDELLKRYSLPERKFAYEQIHFPTSHENMNRAVWRMKFEELFFLQLQLVRAKITQTKKTKGFSFSEVGEMFNRFYKDHLPFELTNAQKRVIKEIRKDMGTGAHMNRLVQGDVGSGKTVVALLCMLIAIDNGFQSCLMAPTEILATQHYQTLSELLFGMPVQIRLLTGSTKTSERNEIHAGIKDGSVHILIGTHALIEPVVQFKNLGLAVIDEQHRFGVEQRFKLWKKNALPPHVLVMTATPIPRTLAMTLYGDLDVSVIDELPPGRKAIKTSHRFDSSRISVFGFMEEQIKAGRQVYVVYPLIEESEKTDYKDLMDGYQSLSRRFPLPEYQISIVHGRMAPHAKEVEMQRFADGKSHIMVATTVIEVGVNVPNASVMVIESAERFGLSQLHQLRGRVGRGADQSYCILMTGNKLSNDARLRMETMCRTNDGFEIAEVDLKLRGPGDIMGTQQSGMLDLKIADLAKDGDVMNAARQAAIDLLEKDPDLGQSSHQGIRQRLSEMLKNRPNWSRIS
ncbi:MAG: ATP-dependent DNA helicase RecG [Flavobacteriales bacterium]|nr:ATP-dependent DNA helicase RecG [Flavobacteriales bacterium]